MAFRERYSSRLCGIFFQTLVQEYDMRLAMHCSCILYIPFEIKIVKCKLCVSSSRFGGMKMLPRAVCSLCLSCNTSVDIVDADDDPDLF